MRELKPCPFCSAEARITKSSNGGMFISCMGRDCYVAMGEHYRYDEPDHEFYEEEAAIGAWNRRAAPTEPNTREE